MGSGRTLAADRVRIAFLLWLSPRPSHVQAHPSVRPGVASSLSAAVNVPRGTGVQVSARVPSPRSSVYVHSGLELLDNVVTLCSPFLTMFLRCDVLENRDS